MGVESSRCKRVTLYFGSYVKIRHWETLPSTEGINTTWTYKKVRVLSPGTRV